MDIISAIDQATGCHQCGNPLGSSPSSDFCSEFCQATWHEKSIAPPAQKSEGVPARVTAVATRSMPVATIYRNNGEGWEEPITISGRLEYRVDPRDLDPETSITNWAVSQWRRAEGL